MMSKPEPRGTSKSHTRREFVRLAAGGTVGVALACAPATPSSAPAPKPAAPAAPPAPAATASGAPTVPRQPDVVRRGTLRGISFGAVIARERGYFAELGVDDQETVFASGVEMIQAGAAGQIDVGATSNTVTFFNAVARGLRQPFVLDIWHLERADRSMMIALRPDLVDQIKQVPDLRGRTNAIVVPVRDGGASFIAKKLFDGNGMTLDDVQWERLGYPDMLVAMGNRAVEVGWVLEPFLTLGKQRGVLVPWLSLGDYDPGHQLAGIVFAESFIKDRNEVAKRWSVGYVRGLRDQHEFAARGKDRDIIAPILGAHTGLTVDVVGEVGWGLVSPDGRLNVESVLDAQRQLIEWGTIPQLLPADQLVDPQFYEYAVQQLGPYRA
jgi:ABC-type nitrate/sulfonate/bicarbonate transport system substrate-binding protein